MQAFDLLVARARGRLGIASDARLARALDYPQDNYIASWRGQIRRGGQGPSFMNLIALLEAAGVFASEPGAAESLLREREALEAELDRVNADLEEQQRRQRQDEEEAEG